MSEHEVFEWIAEKTEKGGCHATRIQNIRKRHH